MSLLGEIIRFDGVGKKDVYNPTAPFVINGTRYMAGRVEDRESFWQDHDYDPQTMFFVEDGKNWIPAENTPIFPWEDPFVTFINDELIFGGIEIFGEPEQKKFKTLFFKGKNPCDLEKFASGPDMMKDIRLVQLSDGRIGVFTRPQGGVYKKGRIGFIVINSLNDLTEENILKAKIIRNELKENYWEGASSAEALENDEIGVLAHIAYIEKGGVMCYQATSFIFNPYTLQVENFKIIAIRDDFPETPAKNSFTKNVVFPGGREKIEDDKHCVYFGLSDTSSGVKTIENPYE